METIEQDQADIVKDYVLHNFSEDEWEGIKAWYEDIYNTDAVYVVFVVRRSYVLALILELYTSLSMDRNGKITLTDGAFLLWAEKLASYYREHQRFPKTVICDDYLIHGRSLNRCIDNMVNRLCRILDENRDTINRAFSQAVEIRVFCYAESQGKLLLSQYMMRVKYSRVLKSAKWREIAFKLSNLILRSGVTNSVYTYSGVIDDRTFVRVMASKEYYETSYFGNPEYTKVDFLEEQDQIKMITAIRILPVFGTNYYRVMPCVFLPNIDENETDNIQRELALLARLQNYPDTFMEMLDTLKSIDGKRTYNEWISFIFTASLLQEFNQKYDVSMDDAATSYVYNGEIKKLVRNVSIPGYPIEEFIRLCITRPILPDSSAMYRIIKNSLLPDRIIMRRSGYNVITDRNREELELDLEGYFYEKGYEEEEDALNYDGFNDTLRIISRKTERGCCFVLRDLLAGCSDDNIRYGMAYIMQLMDAGVLTLFCLPPSDTTVVGYSQFAKAGERALWGLPMRYIEYIPFLAYVYEWCDKMFEDKWEHMEKYSNSEYCTITKDKMEELIQFLKRLEKIGQSPRDWNRNYFPAFNAYMSKEQNDEIFSKVEQRSRYVKQYEEYLRYILRS